MRLRGVALLLGLLPGCGTGGDRLFCDTSGCAFSDAEWQRLEALGWAKLGPPPEDRSNGVASYPSAARLGELFFADHRFSGLATQIDALRRPAVVPRAYKGQPTNLACISCHDLGRAGADTASVPGNVSSGAGWTDVNALAIENCAYQQLYTWNGRADSLWAQAFAVAESPTTMNGNRLNTAWMIADNYASSYYSVFGSFLGEGPPGLLSSPAAGQCPLGPSGECPRPCRVAHATPPATATGCWPRFPLEGKPGAKGGCQPGDDAEPFGDAFDCMDPVDQQQVTRMLVNWAKALAAYETTLISGETPFDRFVREGSGSGAISAAAQRGARLFVGKAGCVDCHGTPLFSDRDFHNVGVPQVGPGVPIEADCPAGGVCDCVTTPNGKNCLPWGALDGLVKLDASKMSTTSVLRTSIWSDDPEGQSRAAEMARAAEVARAPNDALKGAWRTPSLRNVALTAPYMHDGIYATLDEVVAHYNRGGDPGAVGTRAVQIRPLGLTTGDQADLVAFLETLSPAETPAPGLDRVPAYTFDHSAQGWTLDRTASSSLAFDSSTGDPQSGSLRVSFQDLYAQATVEVAPAADLAHRTLGARMLDGGSMVDVAARLVVWSSVPGAIAVGAWTSLVPRTWTEVVLALDAPAYLPPAFDPTHVTRIGVELRAGVEPAGPPAPVTVHIDTVVY